MTSNTTKDIALAASWLEAGKLVAFPTETVYGLGADALNDEAIAQVYAAKKRPIDHPLIVHIAAQADIARWARHVPLWAEQLISVFWPGPLTLVLQRADDVPASVSGGQKSIALRSPAHPCAQALLRTFRNGQGGIVAPSANQFGRVSPTTAAHVREEFPNEYQPTVYLLEGEDIEVGIESTIIDLSRVDQGIGPVLLRPGAITPEHIANAIGVLPQAADIHAPRSSGTLAAHYAPRTPIELVPRAQLHTRLLKLAHKKVALVCTQPTEAFSLAAHIELAPATPQTYARALYALLRRLDAQGYDLIMIEALPQTADWYAINDRLQRAAHAFK